MKRLPQRVICLTEETTETLYLLGADHLLVGISGFVVRPPHARKEKPKVSTYLEVNLEKVRELQPDLIFAWSDLQADICAQLIKEGYEVYCFNHRSVDGILAMIERLGLLVGKAQEAQALIDRLQHRLAAIAAKGKQRKRKPRVYFEEWYDPLISGIRWVSELIELCGGIDIFPELRQYPDARRRIIADPQEVVRRQPDIILVSWCGKMFKPERMQRRPGWDQIPALRNGWVYEIPSAIILQPGPAALTDGVDAICDIIDRWEAAQS